MNDDKIKVTWNDIEQKNNSTATVDWSQATTQEMTKNSISVTNKIIGIVVVAIVFVLIAFFAYSSIKNDYKRHIETVLVADKNIANGLDEKSAVDMAKAVVNRMRSINLLECPDDFQQAYQRHVEAWTKIIPILEEAEDMSSLGSVLINFMIGVAGGYTGRIDLVADKIMYDVNASAELKAAAARVDEEIHGTFLEVLRIAQKYKVNTSPYSN